MVAMKQYWAELCKTKTSPESIAAGFAIGTFISILPTPGLNLLLGCIIIFLFRKISKIALFASFVFWNPLTTVPVYYISLRIGNYLFSNAAIVTYEINAFGSILSYARRFLVGNLIFAAVCSLLLYIIALVITKLYYKFYAKP